MIVGHLLALLYKCDPCVTCKVITDNLVIIALFVEKRLILKLRSVSVLKSNHNKKKEIRF